MQFFVSIPERVLSELKPQYADESLKITQVSIPERVLSELKRWHPGITVHEINGFNP